MAANLAAAGYRVLGFDLDPSRSAPGVESVASAEEAAAAADVAVTMVRTGARPRSSSARLPDPLDVLMMSTVEPELAAELGRRHAGRLTIVDAPVSGGVRGAEAATLAIMRAGPARRRWRARGRCSTCWAARSSSSASEPGLGQAAKLANQVMMGGRARRDDGGARARARLRPGGRGRHATPCSRAPGRAGCSTTGRGCAACGSEYEPGNALDILLKDLRATLEAGERQGVPLPSTDARARAPARADCTVPYSIGIDVGGTFTDFVLLDEESGRLVEHKTPSTPRRPLRGRLAGLEELAASSCAASAFLAQVELIVHGTTVTTNAVLTGHGAKTALLTTEGFRDILEMRRGVRSRKHLYDNKYVAPPPLVPRYLRLPVRERVDVRGERADAARRDARCATAIAPLRGRRASRRSRSASCTPTPSPPTSAAPRTLVAELAPGLFLARLVGDPAAGPAERPRGHDGDERVRRAGAARATSSG